MSRAESICSEARKQSASSSWLVALWIFIFFYGEMSEKEDVVVVGLYFFFWRRRTEKIDDGQHSEMSPGCRCCCVLIIACGVTEHEQLNMSVFIFFFLFLIYLFEYFSCTTFFVVVWKEASTTPIAFSFFFQSAFWLSLFLFLFLLARVCVILIMNVITLVCASITSANVTRFLNL